MKLGEHLLKVAEAGVAFTELPEEEVNLTVLLSIENILDVGRGYATPEERPLISEKLEDIRSKIRNILNSMPIDEAREFMIMRGRQAQNQFSIEQRGE